MKSLILAVSLAVLCAGLAPTDADARRIGGGGSAGMQRSLPARTTPAATPAQPAAPTQAAPATAGAPTPAAAPKRSWLGPVAGLAAGLGIAALMSHFGMGAAMGNIVTMLLVAGLAIFAIRFLMRRFAPGAANAPGASLATPNGMPFQAERIAPGAVNASEATIPSWKTPEAAPANALPPGFDAPAFERTAKLIFIRMQAANDGADLNDLRAFTTPEMFASIRLDLQDRGVSAQRTDVVRVDAEVLDVASEAQRQVVSVRFHGLIREEHDGVAEPFDEIWHLVRPLDGSHEWAIAGIQQSVLA
jgi:predicted lipid-binding transport protein (Tim44 family)